MFDLTDPLIILPLLLIFILLVGRQQVLVSVTLSHGIIYPYVQVGSLSPGPESSGADIHTGIFCGVCSPMSEISPVCWDQQGLHTYIMAHFIQHLRC